MFIPPTPPKPLFATHQAGGLPALGADEALRVLWGYAGLGVVPSRLLLTLRPDWAWGNKGECGLGWMRVWLIERLHVVVRVLRDTLRRPLSAACV